MNNLNLYRPYLCKVLMAHVNDPDVIDDVVQETYLKACLYQKSYRGGSLKSWLSRIALNALKDWFAKESRRINLEVELEGLLEDGYQFEDYEADPYVKLAGTDLVCWSLDQLSDRLRPPFALFLEGEPYEEIASALSISVGTVKSRISRAKEQIRLALQ